MPHLAPTFVGIGGQKCASTWISECLRRHPQVHVTTPKEVRYFTDRRGEGLTWYLSHFKDANPSARAAGEFSSNYIYYPECAERIRNEIGDVAIIAVVREPVSRTLSHIKHLIRDGVLRTAGRSIDKNLLLHWIDRHPQLIRNSLYYDGLVAFRRVFGAERVLVLDQAVFRINGDAALQRAFVHLGVDPMPSAGFANKEVSRGIVPRWQFLERLRIGVYSACRSRAPSLINIVRRLRLGELYRRLNAGEEVVFSGDAVALIQSMTMDDWLRVRTEFLGA